MCRWLAYSGSPVLLEDLLYKPENSLVVQSKHSQMGATTTNGDGFGVGWYGAYETPGLFRSTEPAWNDRNLRELATQAASGRVFAHIRASTGSAVQQTNCHPFRHGRWLWMHNGAIGDFPSVKRDLTLAVEPALFPDIEGSTDSELFFFLALTFGLFQGLMPVIGWAVASTFSEYVTSVDHWIAFGLLALIGGKMLWEAFRGDEHDEPTVPGLRALLVLSVATSVDALAVGVSLSVMPLSIWVAIAVIGATTLLVSLLATWLGHRVGDRLGKPAEIIGGLVLIGIGLKILLEHLGVF